MRYTQKGKRRTPGGSQERAREREENEEIDRERERGEGRDEEREKGEKTRVRKQHK